MSDNDISVDLVGTLMKVVSVDDDAEALHFRLQDGRAGRASGLANLETIKRGDVIILGENRWERARKMYGPSPTPLR